MARVTIIGGGLAGLLTATELISSGVDDVVVLDRGQRAGGVARTIQRDGYSLEPAAGTLLLPHPHLTPVIERLGAEVIPAVDAGLRYVFARDRLVTLPSSPKAAFAPLVPWSAKFRAAAEPFIRRPAPAQESLHGFMTRRLGDGLGTTVAKVAASGVFAGDPHRLSARAAFPALVGLEDSAGSIVRGAIRRLRARPKGAPRPGSWVPVGGMTGVIEIAVKRLGDRYRADHMVESVRRVGDLWEVTGTATVRSDHVVVACRPTDAARLLGGELGSVLDSAIAAPVVVVGIGGSAESVPLLPGFGALAGPDTGLAVLGVLFESSYAPHRAPAGSSLAKVIVGGATMPEVVDWDDDRLLTRVRQDMSRMLGVEVSPSFIEIVRHRPGIPQYELGHGDWLAEVDRLASGFSGLHLTGWGYRGVGVGHVAADATRTAQKIAAS